MQKSARFTFDEREVNLIPISDSLLVTFSHAKINFTSKQTNGKNKGFFTASRSIKNEPDLPEKTMQVVLIAKY